MGRGKAEPAPPEHPEEGKKKTPPFWPPHQTLSLWTLLRTGCRPGNTQRAGVVLSLGNVVPIVGTTIPIRQQVPRTGGPAPPGPTEAAL